jgi:hypothetical protein
MRINDPNLLRQVVNYLDKHQETIRIKKMLYCLCTGRWEKDDDYLNSINFQYLVEQIVRENYTLDLLRLLLHNLLGTVNKPKKYIEIAKIIYLAIGQLYPEFHQEHIGKNKPVAPRVAAVVTPPARIPDPEPIYASTIDLPVASAFQRAYTPEPTQAYTSQGVPSSLQRAYAPEPTQAYTSQGVPSSLQRAYAPQPTQQFTPEVPDDDVDESAYETYCAPDWPEQGQAEEVESAQAPTYDPFVLRQSVMSYANPLRAKIILLLMLRPDFNFSSQSVTMMREYLLDDLLVEIFQFYPTICQLEEGMTDAVEQLAEIEEYGKAANGLLQALIPIYAKAGSRH